MSKDKTEDKVPPMQIGEALMRQMKSRKIGKSRFRFPLSHQQAYQLIGASYNVEVESRCRKCEFGEFTLDKIWQVARIITEEHPKFGILFAGQVGNGKTTLVYALSNAAKYLADSGQINPADYGYAHSSDFCIEFYSAKQLVRIAKSDWKRFEAIMNKPMIAIDELGEEPKEIVDYGNVINPIIDLIEHRYACQRFTVITSNLNPKKIAEKYGARISDRFREMLAIVSFADGESFR